MARERQHRRQELDLAATVPGRRRAEVRGTPGDEALRMVQEGHREGLNNGRLVVRVMPNCEARARGSWKG